MGRRNFLCALVCAFSVWLVLYSSFFTNLRGLPAFFECWSVYIRRGTGNTGLTQPFWQYVRWLFWWEQPPLPVWSEWLIGIGFVLGVLGLFIGKLRPAGVSLEVLLFALGYSAALLLVYSLLPYKTPWCGLGVLHGMSVVAGIGYAGIIWERRGWLGQLLLMLYGAGCLKMYQQCCLTVGRYGTDSRNPYVYAHTQRDFLRIIARKEMLEKTLGRRVHLSLIMDHEHHWPLPWYVSGKDRVDYCDYRGKGNGEKVVAEMRAILSQHPDMIVTLPDYVEQLDGGGEYEWEDVTLRTNMLIKLGVLKR